MENNYNSLPTSNTSNNGVSGCESNQKSLRNFKLLSDPALVKGAIKLYRYDGIVSSDPTYPSVLPRDPRNPVIRLRSRSVEPMVLTVPRLKIDQNYVGIPPAVEITITNLNDNIDKQFLATMLEKCGNYDEIIIYYHPANNKHLGIARIVFENSKSASLCIEKYNQKSVMGKVLNVILDPFGNMCKETVDNLVSSKPKSTTLQTAYTTSSTPHLFNAAINSNVPVQHELATSLHRHEYIPQNNSDPGIATQYYRDRDYNSYTYVRENRYQDDNRPYRNCLNKCNGREHSRERYSPIMARHKRDRTKHHQHYHRKRNHSRDRSRERGSSIRNNRQYERSRDRDYDRRDREHDYREKEHERSLDMEREHIYKSRSNENYSSSRYLREHIELTTSSSTVSTYLSSTNYYSYQSSGDGVAKSSYMASQSTPHPYRYHSYSYSKDPNNTHLWPPTPNWTEPQPPPPPPDDTPDWNEPEPPPAEEYRIVDSLPEVIDVKHRDNGAAINNPLKLREGKQISMGSDSGNVDLDTRIALMFKGKSFGNAPPFLQMDSSDSDIDKSGRKEGQAEENEMNSNSCEVPSPLHNNKGNSRKNLKSHSVKYETANQHAASDISSSDEDILLKKDSHSSTLNKHVRKNDEDRMSLSSLSSHSGNQAEDHKHHPVLGLTSIAVRSLAPATALSTLTATTSLAVTAAPITTSYSCNAQSNDPSSYYYSNGYVSYANQNISTATPYFPNPAYIESSYLPGLAGGLPGFRTAANYYDPYKHYRANYFDSFLKNQEEDPFKLYMEEVVTCVSDELKQILKRDFNKRMIENTAYKYFEAWWNEKLQKSRCTSTGEKDNPGGTVGAGLYTTALSTSTRIDKPPDINQLINCQRDISDFSSTYHLSIPKLPSFRRIRKPAQSPKHKISCTENHLSDQEEMVQDSDSEKEDSRLGPISRGVNVVKDCKNALKTKALTSVERRTKRRGSSSSFFSSSSSEIGNEDVEDDDEDVEGSSDDGDGSVSADELSSITDDEVNHKHHKDRSLIRQRPVLAQDLYSDSEEDLLKSKPSKAYIGKVAIKSYIYSDTDCEEDAQETKSTRGETNKGKENTTTFLPALAFADLEDISKDSSFSLGGEDVQMKPSSIKEIKGQTASCDYTVTSDVQHKHKGCENVERNKKSAFEYDRIYSDSEEEREYQEKQRRKIEYMAQIEREFLEDQQRRMLEAQEKKEMELPEKSDIKVVDSASNDNGKMDKYKQQGSNKKQKVLPVTIKSRTPDDSKKRDSPLKALKACDISASDALLKLNTVKLTDSNVTESEIPKTSDKLSNIKRVSDLELLIPENKLPTSRVDKSAQMLMEGERKPPNMHLENAHLDIAKMSPASSDGCSSQASQASQVALEHCYSLPPQAHLVQQKPLVAKVKSDGEPPLKNQHNLRHDHGGYATPPITQKQLPPLSISAAVKQGPGRPRKDRTKKNEQIESRKRYYTREKKSTAYEAYLKAIKSFVPCEMFKPREAANEMMTLYEFLTKGIDAEDVKYIHRSYEMHLQEDTYGFWLNNTHWVEHCFTDRTYTPPPNKKMKKDELYRHSTGCARTEGFYKLDIREKAKHKYHHAKATVENASNFDRIDDQLSSQLNKQLLPKMQGISREARSNQRRLLTAYASIGESELLKFNQLKFRKKQLKFAKSAIHDWGLFALEPIAADEMVIEYVGQMIRPMVADLREVKYEAIGIGSSYLFRIDSETIIDATKCGNLARFINHSCNPNCYAKVITIESEKKIVIYSKQPIGVNEEITYDYKFPLEEEKIPCLCGAQGCRGTLN